jgi:hypothetical protein
MLYVTEEQRRRRPIFIATLRAERLLAGCFVAHRSKTTAGILPLTPVRLEPSRIQPKYPAAPLLQSLTWCTKASPRSTFAVLCRSFPGFRRTGGI